MSRAVGFSSRVRVVIAGSLLATGLAVPVAVATSSASASEATFCTAVFSWAKHPGAVPTKLNIGSYHAWARVVLPYYERMQATAPNAKTKQILGFLVTVLKAYESDKTLGALSAYESVHKAQFTADVKSLAASIEACATSGIKLP